MKTISQLNGTDFLRQCNKIRHGVAEILKNTKIMEIRKTLPTFKGDETLEQRKEMIQEQGRKNFDKILDVLLEEKPEETLKLFRLLIILDEGEQEPDGLEMLMIGMSILTEKRVVDFLASLMQLGLMNTGD